MEPKDRKRFAHCLLAASELYGKPVSESVTAIWWDALKAYDIGAVEVAFRRHFSNPDSGQFMPKPADIVRVVAGSSQDGAMVAWAKVDKAVRQVGPYAERLLRRSARQSRPARHGRMDRVRAENRDGVAVRRERVSNAVHRLPPARRGS
jgi:hypothetical protein